MHFINESSIQIIFEYTVTNVLTQPREKSQDCYPTFDKNEKKKKTKQVQK